MNKINQRLSVARLEPQIQAWVTDLAASPCACKDEIMDLIGLELSLREPNFSYIRGLLASALGKPFAQSPEQV